VLWEKFVIPFFEQKKRGKILINYFLYQYRNKDTIALYIQQVEPVDFVKLILLGYRLEKSYDIQQTNTNKETKKN
jgi:uncharacterized membrane protein